MTRFGRTAGAAATYVVLAGLQRGVSLLILPFVTRAMAPSEYGAASMVGSASVVLTAIIATPLVPLIIRAAARGEDDGPAILRVAGTYCYLVVPGLLALAAFVLAVFVPEMLGVSGYIWAIQLAAVGFWPASTDFALYVAQAREDIRRFVWLSSISVLISAGSKVLFVVVWQLGVLGWVTSDLLSAVLAALLAVALVRLPRVRVDMDHIRYAVKFTLPLVPHAASLWALNSISRPAMAAVSSLEQVGLLAVGLNLAQIAGLVLSESNRAALPRYSRETLPAPTSETLGPVRWQLIGAFVAPAIIGCGVAVGGQWVFPDDYWAAFTVTGVLLIGQAAYGLYLIPMNYLTQTGGLPKFSALASGAGAAVILVSILLLGHRFGAIGVAYATAAGYLTMAVVALALTVMHKLDIAWRTWLANWPEVILAAGSLACCVAALASPVGSSQSWLGVASCLMLAMGALVATARREHS